MRAFWNKWGVWILLALYAAAELMYFPTLLFSIDRHPIHSVLDDVIPFVPVFIVPYVLWYPYVPGLLLLMAWKDRESFLRRAPVFLCGTFLCWLIIFLYPSYVDFVPVPEGRDVFSALCRLIYAIDQPINVFPSLHCTEAVLIHLVVFRSDFFKKKKALRIVSAVYVVIVCLSTVFVKQHSVLDLFGGVALALTVYFTSRLIAYCVQKHKSKLS